ncbi:NOP protein chaperone 1 isoform X1 [Chrysemys picta bellii]|uniref:NOP protein chaperone 1 isoform X1 n=1 Tax=Chrysemys picta bellii TaxID=8478 RepID=UPI0032B2787B
MVATSGRVTRPESSARCLRGSWGPASRGSCCASRDHAAPPGFRLTGIHDTLLINSKHASKKVTNLETVRIPRSNILDRVQSFLPQMALANNELRREMATAPAHQFDIENLDSCLENIIEMNVAVVELSGSDTDEEEIISEDSSESEEDSCATDEVTIDTIKLPKQKGEKGKIEILDSKVNE